MSCCFPCFSPQKSKRFADKNDGPPESKCKEEEAGQETIINSKNFTFRELATATKNFRQECLLGEGCFGRVFKATLQKTGQVVAVKQLDRNGQHGNKEFLAEVMTLSHLNHSNLVNLVGYCADGDQRLLVYEYMAGGSVEDRVIDVKEEEKALDWYTRIKIASGAALGLQYLHDTANPPLIYRDLKSSNILLDEDVNPKLSDFGLAKLEPVSSKTQGSSRVMGTYGYCAPEYTRSNELTSKSDVYSYGVVLLELITGRRVIDTTNPIDEQNLVAWAQPFFRDPKKFKDLADPILGKKFPEKDLNQAVAMAAMCLQEEPGARPWISDVVTALSFLSTTPAPEPPPVKHFNDQAKNQDSASESSNASSYSSENEEEEGENAYSCAGKSQKQNISDDEDHEREPKPSVANSTEDNEVQIESSQAASNTKGSDNGSQDYNASTSNVYNDPNGSTEEVVVVSTSDQKSNGRSTERTVVFIERQKEGQIHSPKEEDPFRKVTHSKSGP